MSNARQGLRLIQSLALLSVAVLALSAVRGGVVIRANPQSQVRDRTTPLLQRMDTTQQSHSRLYERLRDDQRPFKSRVRFLDRNEDALESADDMFDLGEESRPLPVVARELACGADAVFVATIQSADSFPISDGTFLFTDYSVVLEDVLRAGTASHLQPGIGTIVTRLGGKVVVEGKPRRALVSDLPMLTTGAKYLFFAKYLPQTRDFEVNKPVGAYVVSGKFVRALRSRDKAIFHETGGPEPTADAVFEEIRKVTCR